MPNIIPLITDLSARLANLQISSGSCDSGTRDDYSRFSFCCSTTPSLMVLDDGEDNVQDDILHRAFNAIAPATKDDYQQQQQKSLTESKSSEYGSSMMLNKDKDEATVGNLPSAIPFQADVSKHHSFEQKKPPKKELE